MAEKKGFYLIGVMMLSILLAKAQSGSLPDISYEELSRAPTTDIIDDLELVAEVAAWRDYTKNITPDTHITTIQIEIRGATLPRIPVTMEVDGIYLVRGKTIWKVKVVEMKGTRTPGNVFFTNAANGPDWEVGSVAKCIIRIIDRKGQVHLIRTKDIRIKSLT